MERLTGLTKWLGPLLVAALLVAGYLTFTAGSDGQTTLTARFPRTVSLYEGSDVRILGVPVGKVETVEPQGTDVKVTMYFDSQYQVPADAKAVIISPAIVGDRFVQLTPVYTGGPQMKDGTVISAADTSTPLELDEIYQSIDDLAVALGPQGANNEGALNNLVESTARNFAGQGEQFNQTLTDLGQFTGTLAHNKDELFGTVREIERFVSALAKNDSTVRNFNSSLAGAADLLKDERGDLAAALKNLGTAMVAVHGFVKQNKGVLSRNIKGLNRLTKILLRQRSALKETLTDAPLALNNLFLTYNQSAGTLDTRSNQGEVLSQLVKNPSAFLCAIIKQGPQGKKSCKAVKDVIGTAGLGDILGQLPLPRSAPGAAAAPAPSHGVVEQIDRSLGGLVEVSR